MLKQYTLESVLGCGGFGITYKAKDRALGRWVAIKELLPMDLVTRRPGCAEVLMLRSGLSRDFDWAMKRFMQEGRALAACEHSAVVQVHEVFQANGTAYLVTAYAEGCRFDKWAENFGRLPEESELLDVLLPTLDGLEVVHHKGYLHRDIKPSNLYIRDQGGPVLLDFGSARHVISERTRSLTSVLTPKFAPWEQYVSTEEQGPYTDIYALAALVIWTLRGGDAVPEAIDRLDPKRGDPFVPLADDLDLGRRYSPGFLRAIDWGFAVAPRDRPRSVAEFRKALGGREGSPPRARAPRRDGWKWALVTAVSGFLCFAGFGLWYVMDRGLPVGPSGPVGGKTGSVVPAATAGVPQGHPGVLEERAAQVAPATQPVVVGPVPPSMPVAGPAKVDEEKIRRFIEGFIEMGNTGAKGFQIGFYAPRVEYFDNGEVDREFIAKDMIDYTRKWPQRSYRIAGTPQISFLEGGLYEVKVRIDYDCKGRFGSADNRNKPHKGTVEDVIILRPVHERDTFEIVSIRSSKVN